MLGKLRLFVLFIAIPVSIFAQEFRTDNSTGNLLDANGNNFIMKGINIPLAWYVADVNGSIAALRSNTGINCARIVIETSTNEASWKACVEACIANDIIPMVELHDVTGSTNTTDIQTMANFWITHANYLTSEAIRPYILINICNEWGTWAVANSSGDQWRDGFNQAVTSMRNAGITSTIVIDGVGYGQDIDDAKNIRQYAAGMITNDPEHNLLFSIHMYCEWAIGGDDIPGTLQWVRDNNIPFIVGEFGYQHATDGSCDIDEDLIMQECDNKGIGWLAWSQKGNSGGVEYLDLCNDWACSSLSDWGTSVFEGTHGTKTGETCSIFNGIGPSCEQPNLGNDRSLCGVSGGITLDANITNTTNKTFTWYLNGSQISGNSVTLSVSQAGNYIVEVDSAGVCVKTDEVEISATIPSPTLADISLCSPAQANLETGVSGSGLSHTWFLNNTEIEGENNETLTNVRTPGTYRVEVSAIGCTSVSDEAIVSSNNPTPIDNCRANTGELTLELDNTTGTNYNWYTSAEGSTLAPGTSTGVTSYTTPSLSTTTTYYVQNMNAVNSPVGPTSLAGTNTNWGVSNGIHIQFDVMSDFSITSMDIPLITYNAGVITIEVEVINNSGESLSPTQIFTGTSDGSVSASTDQMVTFLFTDFDIKAAWGSSLRLRMTSISSGNPLFTDANSAVPYPYTINNIVSITGSTGAQGNQYNYFYNWNISTGSVCDRLPVVAQIDASCGTPNTLPTVAITSPTQNSSMDIGETLTITATANDSDGSIASVQFFANGTSISTDNTSPYSTSWNPASAGSYELTAIATDNDGGTQTSTAIAITIEVTATISALSETTFCEGGSVTLSANTGTGLSYQWNNNGTAISGATNSTYTATESGSYSCTVSNETNSATSDAITVTVYEYPNSPIVSTPVYYEVGETASVLDAVGDNILWYTSQTGVGETTAPTPPTLTETTHIYYATQTVNGCESDFAIIEVIVDQSEITQTIELAAGWNFISINVLPTDSNISTLFSGLTIDIVKNADGFWKNGQINEMNSITNITAGKGYLVFMNSAGTFSATGLAMNENSIDITSYTAGWHMVGTPYQTPTQFPNTLDVTNCDLIKNFDGFWIPEDATSSIDSFVPGEAYYYRHP